MAVSNSQEIAAQAVKYALIEAQVQVFTAIALTFGVIAVFGAAMALAFHRRQLAFAFLFMYGLTSLVVPSNIGFIGGAAVMIVACIALLAAWFDRRSATRQGVDA